MMRNTKYKHLYIKLVYYTLHIHKARKPVLDVPTIWGLTYVLIEVLLENQKIYETEEFQLTEEDLRFYNNNNKYGFIYHFIFKNFQLHINLVLF